MSHLLAERERLDRIYTVRDGKTFDRWVPSSSRASYENICASA